ncbi:MAG TPA: hypothetical protein VK568_14135 [Thermodesulfobacteriota bacterium]|nr:hypothetical protein [Thermodesulfobacteriota bacterium]
MSREAALRGWETRRRNLGRQQGQNPERDRLEEAAKFGLFLSVTSEMLQGFKSNDGKYPEDIKEWVSENLAELADAAGYTLVPIVEKAWPLRRIIRS